MFMVLFCHFVAWQPWSTFIIWKNKTNKYIYFLKKKKKKIVFHGKKKSLRFGTKCRWLNDDSIFHIGELFFYVSKHKWNIQHLHYLKDKTSIFRFFQTQRSATPSCPSACPPSLWSPQRERWRAESYAGPQMTWEPQTLPAIRTHPLKRSHRCPRHKPRYHTARVQVCKKII